MLEFPENYFDNEKRDDFMVDTTMKTVWAAELEVLNEVAVICARHGFQWYAAYGTLLGAVRHQGFIPWDDDIDIWLKREDYRELIELLPKELPEGYIVRAPHKRPGYPEYQVYVNNSDHISISPERLSKFHGCPFYVGIDLFPLDEIPVKEDTLTMQRALFSSALLLQELDYEAKHEKVSGSSKQHGCITTKAALERIRGLSDVLRTEYGIRLDKHLIMHGRKEELLARLWEIAEELPQKDGNSKQLVMYLGFLRYGITFNKEWFDEVVYLPFEGFDIPVPGNYESVLLAVYGEGYRTPVRHSGEHEYPCYKGQLEELRKRASECQNTEY